ncbi:hypothetical protein AZ78_0129 [Lysobacter capsici AZ78]|uniref:Uncharacterized protein n=1 Tax=Lysobacter capsici AZ78 TaxID=1444315 RepID=A0A125U0C0_9GAMM|nr:hypothetical protein AZ78_0129 [Lysobacter capsici AZ78]
MARARLDLDLAQTQRTGRSAGQSQRQSQGGACETRSHGRHLADDPHYLKSGGDSSGRRA